MSAQAQGKTAIILVNWNGWRDSIACIRSCLTLRDAPFRIILCDNASADGSVDHIMRWARGEVAAETDPHSPVPLTDALPQGVALLDRAAAEAGDDGGDAQLIIVPTGGNLGFAGGNNVGLRWAMARDFDYMWLLNNDTVVPPDALSALIAHCKAGRGTVGPCGSVLLEYEDPAHVQALAGAMNMRNAQGRHVGVGLNAAKLSTIEDIAKLPGVGAQDLVYPVGASMLVDRAFIEKVGLMEESYFLYYEEADWVCRARGQFTPAIAAASHVYHRHGASAGSTPDGLSVGSVSFLYRSRLLFARRFIGRRPIAVILGMLNEAARALARGRTAKWRAMMRAIRGKVSVPAPGGGS